MKKCGRKIMQKNVVIPLGAKKSDFELAALSSLTAMLTNNFTDTHNAHLYVLADMCSKFESEPHVQRHIDALHTIINEIHSAEYKGASRWYLPAKSSVMLLIGFISAQSNSKILDYAAGVIERIAA